MQEHLFNRNRIRQNKMAAVTSLGDNFLHAHVERSFLDKLLCFPQRFARILILGHCSGSFVKYLTQQFPDSILIKADCVPSAPFIDLICEEDRLPFSEKTFDLIISHLTLHLYDAPQRILSEAYRTLKVGGLYLCTFLGGKTFFELRSVLMNQELMHTKGAGQRVIPMIDSRTAASLIQHSSLKEPITESNIVTASFPSLSRLHKYIKSLGEQCPLLTPSPPLSKKIVQHLEMGYKNDFPSPESDLSATFELLSYTGWKD